MSKSLEFLQKYPLPKAWFIEKSKHGKPKLYCPLFKSPFELNFGLQKKLSPHHALFKALGLNRGLNRGLNKELNRELKPELNPAPYYVLDATSGWLKDAFLMAQGACRVRAIECHPFVFHFAKESLEAFYRESLLKSSLSDSSLTRDSLSFFPGSLELLFGNSIDYLHSLKNYEDYPDVIFMDPLFAGRKKSSSKKDLRILQELNKHNLSEWDQDFQHSAFDKGSSKINGSLAKDSPPDKGGQGGSKDFSNQTRIKANNKQELFKIALLKAKKRLVVKRHKLDKALGPKALFCFKGQSVCYDVFQAKGG